MIIHKNVATLSLLFAAIPWTSGSVIVVPINVNDQGISASAATWVGQPSARAGGDASAGATYVLPFALPEIPVGETITSATLTINLQGWGHFGAPQGDAELFGIDRFNNAATVVISTDWIDNRTTMGSIELKSGQSVLDDSLIPYSAISGSSGGSGLTEAYTSGDISAFILSLYGNGAVADQYGFLAISGTMSTLTSQYYEISTANSPTVSNQPYLTITTSTIPEPATYALLGGIMLLGVIFFRRRR